MKQGLKLLLFMLLTTCMACTGSHDEAIDQGLEAEATRADNPIDTDYYWYQGQKIPLPKIDGKYYIVYYTTDAEKLENELDKAGIVPLDVREWDEFRSYSFDLTGSGVKKFKNYKTAFIDGSYEQFSPALPYMLYWSHGYTTEKGDEIGVMESFVVKLKVKTTLSQLEMLAQENAVEMIGADKFSPGWYMLACTNLSKGNSLEMANLFYDSGLFVESSPSFWGGIIFDGKIIETFEGD